MQNANVLTWLQELIQRFFTKSPLFFKIWTIVSGALVLITGVPELLSTMNIHIPDLWNVKVTAAVAWASRAALFMSLLTTQSKPVGVTKTGEVVKATNENKLPFTAATEQMSAVKNEVTKVEVNPV